jgi:predicted transcriptional regulator YheO
LEHIADEKEFLTALLKALAAQWGEKCEVVLHDWSVGYEQTIVAIEGHVTGRKVGDCGSNLGLEVMRGTVQNGDIYNYVTQTKDGKILRSSTVYIKNKEHKPIGALCINFDISDLMTAKKTIESLIMNRGETAEYFASDVNDLLDFLIQESIKLVGKPVTYMTKEDKLKALDYLDEKGAFLITKSGNKICQFFDISKYTLYNYLDEIRIAKEKKTEPDDTTK